MIIKDDNEIYILGSDTQRKSKKSSKRRWIILGVFIVILIRLLFILFSKNEQTPEYYFEPEAIAPQSIVITSDSTVNYKAEGYIEAIEDTINDVPLLVYVPHNASMRLALGLPDKFDSTIVFAAMAADIRKDNEKIVGDFILSGEQLARGIAKKGFCAIDNNKVTISVGESTPLLQQTIDNKGFFFRQYALVHNGELVENKPKNKSIRRALAIQNERVVMVESKSAESFHDFSQALIDIGVSDAIYLVGGNAYGWYYSKNIRKEFGEEQTNLPNNISYIIWQVK